MRNKRLEVVVAAVAGNSSQVVVDDDDDAYVPCYLLSIMCSNSTAGIACLFSRSRWIS